MHTRAWSFLFWESYLEREFPRLIGIISLKVKPLTKSVTIFFSQSDLLTSLKESEIKTRRFLSVWLFHVSWLNLSSVWTVSSDLILLRLLIIAGPSIRPLSGTCGWPDWLTSSVRKSLIIRRNYPSYGILYRFRDRIIPGIIMDCHSGTKIGAICFNVIVFFVAWHVDTRGLYRVEFQRFLVVVP